MRNFIDLEHLIGNLHRRPGRISPSFSHKIGVPHSLFRDIPVYHHPVYRSRRPQLPPITVKETFLERTGTVSLTGKNVIVSGELDVHKAIRSSRAIHAESQLEWHPVFRTNDHPARCRVCPPIVEDHRPSSQIHKCG